LKKLLLAVILGIFGWQVFAKYQGQILTLVDGARTAEVEYAAPSSNPQKKLSLSSDFKCDGRTHCSQMTSCDEATFFLRNCPGVKMDGDHDGIPCEQQWCN
jgi:hypothetical protein